VLCWFFQVDQEVIKIRRDEEEKMLLWRLIVDAEKIAVDANPD
jgi:hypothetical protein